MVTIKEIQMSYETELNALEELNMQSEMRKRGECPHSKLKCIRAKLCVLGKQESCSKLLAEEFTCCSKCKRKNKKQCTWECFRNIGG